MCSSDVLCSTAPLSSPVGSSHLVLHRSRSHYTWNRVATTIHNIIVGSPWIDQVGGEYIIGSNRFETTVEVL